MRYGDDDAIVMRDAFEGRARPQPFGPPVAMLPGAGAPEFRPPVDFPPSRPGQPSPGQPAPMPNPAPVQSSPPMGAPMGPSLPPGVFGYAPGLWMGGGPFLPPGRSGGGAVATQPRQTPTLGTITTARPSSVSYWGVPWGGWGMPGPSSPQPGAFRTSPGQMSGFIRG